MLARVPETVNALCIPTSDFPVARGLRIKLSEIEVFIVARAGVAEATVILREDVPDQQRLVAYYTEGPGCLRMAAQLRAELAPELPECLIPLTTA